MVSTIAVLFLLLATSTGINRPVFASRPLFPPVLFLAIVSPCQFVIRNNYKTNCLFNKENKGNCIIHIYNPDRACNLLRTVSREPAEKPGQTHIFWYNGPMTKHEALEYLSLSRKPVSKKHLSQYFSIAYTTSSEALNRYHDQKLVRAIHKEGKEIFYGLAERGYERLHYFEQGGCPNQKCSCRTL